MAKFSDLRVGAVHPDAPQTAFRKALLTPAIALMIADAIVEDSELDQLHSLCSLNPALSGVTGAALEKLVVEIHENIERIGREQALSLAADELVEAQRHTAFCFATHIALADGSVDESERAALIDVGQILQIDDETFGKVIDVFAMLHSTGGAGA